MKIAPQRMSCLLTIALVFSALVLNGTPVGAAQLVFTDIGANLTGVDGASVAWGDYDNDGYLDLLISGSGTSYIYHNNGDGTFTLAAELSGISYGQAVWGDFNNDGRLDVMQDGFSGGNEVWQIYRNDGSNTFTSIPFPVPGFGNMTTPSLRFVSCAWGDYDNDGKLDALFVGWPYSALYHNNGSNSFSNSGFNIPAPGYSDVAWGDYNNDGYLDFVVNGGGGTGMTALYQNLSGTNIVPATNVLTGVYEGSAAWDDFNKDGNLDLAVTGLNNNQGIYISFLLVGDGHGGFTNSSVSIDGTVYGSVAWGDFDNDGWPDLVVSSDAGTGTTKIYRNNGNGTFTDSGVSLPGCGDGGIAVGDFNNDGKLDIAIVGSGVAKIFRNDTAVSADSPPSIPQFFHATPTTNAMVLSWTTSMDGNYYGGVSYNIRVGTTPGGIDVVSPMADPATGFRRIPAIGNAGLGLSRTVTHLQAGTYYWGVQAIDHSFAGSAFTTEASFTIAAPSFTTQPASQTNTLGTTVSFQVATSGTLPMTYQWYFNGAALTDAGRVSGSATTNLVISNIQVPDAGGYSVVAANAAGSTTSLVATLTIPAPPVIVSSPTNILVDAGGTATLNITAAGSGPFTYQWEFNSTNIDSATNATLTFTNVQLSQSGDYPVAVSNAYGGTVSTNVTLTVIPLSVSALPQSESVNGGATATFNGSVSGQGPFTYRWQFDSTNIPNATNSTLSLTNAQASQTGAYTVQVNNGYGVETSSNALLTVTPQVAIQPPAQLAAFGATVTFTAVEGGLDSGPLFQWQFMGTNLPAATNNPLVLTNVQLTQTGVYDVIASNAFGTATSSNAVLSINDVVEWGDNTYNQTNVPAGLTNIVAIATGNSFTLAVRSDGTVVGWGSDTDGETTVPAGLSNVVAVAAGNNFSVALEANGSVVAWGDNTYSATNVPAGLSNVTAIACNNEHVDALKSDGTVVSWGYYPLVGPASAPAGLSNIVAISAGAYTSLAVKNDGSVTGWGPAANGELSFPASLTNVAAIAGGGYHCVAARHDGTVLAWGNNGSGQTSVPAGLSNVVAVAAGSSFSIALKNNGTVVVWGDNSSGERNVPAGLVNPVAIAADGNNAAVLLNNGAPEIESQPYVQPFYTGQTIDLYATVAGSSPLSFQWQFDGTNIAGATNSLLALANAQFGNIGTYSFVVSNSFGSAMSSNVSVSVLASAPFILSQPTNEYSFIGSNATFSASANGSWPLTYQWQYNGANIDNATNFSLTLTNLQLSEQGTFTLIVSNAYGYVVSSNAVLFVSPVVMWGSPSNQPPGLTNVMSIAANPAVLRWDGTIAWWNNSSAFKVSGVSNVVAIPSSLLEFQNPALLANGNVILWDTDGGFKLTGAGSSNSVAITAGNYGDLELRSNGTVVGSVLSGAPGNVVTVSNAVAVAEGGQHSLLLKSDGTVLAWGNNSSGQATVPSGLSNVVAIAAGSLHSLALKGDGTVIAWGNNASHQTNVPPGLSNVVAIAAGASHNLALRNDGTVVAWGFNSSHQTNVPPGLSNVLMIAAGTSDSMALVGYGPPVLQVPLVNPMAGSNSFSFTLPTHSGRVYALEFRTNLTQTNWTALPLVAGNGTNVVLTDAGATNAQRFYRVLQW